VEIIMEGNFLEGDRGHIKTTPTCSRTAKSSGDPCCAPLSGTLNFPQYGQYK